MAHGATSGETQDEEEGEMTKEKALREVGMLARWLEARAQYYEDFVSGYDDGGRMSATEAVALDTSTLRAKQCRRWAECVRWVATHAE